MKLGITGHQALGDDEAIGWIRHELRLAIQGTAPPLKGISCLAEGADQLFSEVVLELGGVIHAVIPFPDYDDAFTNVLAKENYQRLRKLSATEEVLPLAQSWEESFFAAGKHVTDTSDKLIAVWDGLPAQGLGGTADIVRYAQMRKIPIIQVNPVSKQTCNFERHSTIL